MALGIKEDIEGAFGRHETFTIRYGWLKRGFDEAIADPRLFYADDAHHRLGVGKNMAKSIRFWLSATRLMGEATDPDDRRRTVMRPTWFGYRLLAAAPTVDGEKFDTGLHALGLPSEPREAFDPYLEDPNSWWLIHWMMLSPGGRLPVWWSAFHTFGAVSFSVDALLEHVHAQIDATSAWTTPTAPTGATVRKDVLALLRAYAGTSGSRRADKADDAIDAPMVQLNLIQPGDSGMRFTIGPKPDLAPEVVAFACLDFLARTGVTARTALIPTLASEVGGPGRAFKLTETDMVELLGKAAASSPDLIELSSSTGADTMSVVGSGSLAYSASAFLQRYYAAHGRGRSGEDAPLLSPDMV